MNNPTHPQIIPLWADGAIDTTGWDQSEEIAFLQVGIKVMRNVV